jgi:hypothetical protein
MTHFIVGISPVTRHQLSDSTVNICPMSWMTKWDHDFACACGEKRDLPRQKRGVKAALQRLHCFQDYVMESIVTQVASDCTEFTNLSDSRSVRDSRRHNDLHLRKGVWLFDGKWAMLSAHIRDMKTLL